MKYRMPGRLGAMWDSGQDPFGMDMGPALAQAKRDREAKEREAREREAREREAEKVTDPAKISWILQGVSPPRDEGKDEETSPLVWVAGLGAAGMLAYLLLKK